MQPVYGGAGVQTHLGKGNFRRNPAIGRGTGIAPAYIYAFPVYVGVYDNSNAQQDQEAQPEQAPPERAVPVMIEAGPDGEYTTTAPPQTSTVYQPEQRPETLEEPAKPADPPHYLLAFKDHSIYSAVAYWVDGDTLHYFTAGNVHNQASMSLVDRPLTERLNRELGIDFTLPPPSSLWHKAPPCASERSSDCFGGAGFSLPIRAQLGGPRRNLPQQADFPSASQKSELRLDAQGGALCHHLLPLNRARRLVREIVKHARDARNVQ